MDCDTDYLIKLTTETEHSNLYKWCLQEFNAEGEQVGSDLIPWNWSLEFDVTNICYQYSLENEKRVRFGFDEEAKAPEEEVPDIDFQVSEVMYASLIPVEGRYRRTSYSMVGTDREVKDIRLRIEKTETDSCDL